MSVIVDIMIFYYKMTFVVKERIKSLVRRRDVKTRVERTRVTLANEWI